MNILRETKKRHKPQIAYAQKYVMIDKKTDVITIVSSGRPARSLSSFKSIVSPSPTMAMESKNVVNVAI